jgi:uncharacterized protein YbcC (UPF0753/DUF2309 family)
MATFVEKESGLASVVERAIDDAAHLLPQQGPLDVFVHHNTLHSFEDLPFEEGVVRGGVVYGCEPYLGEDRYHAAIDSGRISTGDIDAVLSETLGECAEEEIGGFATRRAIRAAMLSAPLRRATDVELHWLIDDTDAARHFDAGAPPEARDAILADASRLMDAFRNPAAQRGGLPDPVALGAVEVALAWSMGWDLERIALAALWQACVECAARNPAGPVWDTARESEATSFERALAPASTEKVNAVLIPFASAFLDQGLARWPVPDRDLGFLACFTRVMSVPTLRPHWLKQLPQQLADLVTPMRSAPALAADLLVSLGVQESDIEHAVRATLLALPGWSGMLGQAEHNPAVFRVPATKGTLCEYVVVRLLLMRLVASETSESHTTEPWERAGNASHDAPAFVLFQVAQRLGWGPTSLFSATREQRELLLTELSAFTELERRRVMHLAYERHYREAAFRAFARHAPDAMARSRDATDRPIFQVVCCIDEREESFRRAIEEVEPRCETLGLAGFFGVAMNYRGVDEARFRPLCPVNIAPRHHVAEEPLFSFEEMSRRQAELRQRLARAAGAIHHGHHSLLGGAMAGALGLAATVPLIATVLAPRLSSRVLRIAGRAVTPPATVLRLERNHAEPGPEGEALGYSVDEMVEIVWNNLRVMGLANGFSRLVLMVGHGSSSRNNPHRAAYDCGACGGGRGGPNARAFALMANDSRVRQRLAQRGLTIPADTVFVGAYHNTCNEDVLYYDLDAIPASHRSLFIEARGIINTARLRNAHERCRRFVAAPKHAKNDRPYLWHLQTRAEDLSQVRPEYGHGSNAICLVGRRAWSRGLFLDRRAFLTSYDPTQDEDGSLLSALLGAVVPVCGGINLEYYFSTVDQTGYGCGTKLPHNVAGLIGVMNGTLDDLQPGLPYQTVEIHEPMRLLMVVEAPADRIDAVIASNDTVRRFIDNTWVQFARLDPETGEIEMRRSGAWVEWDSSVQPIPVVPDSRSWYAGKRSHIGFASIIVDRGNGAGHDA